MDVDQAEPAPEEAVLLDEKEDFMVRDAVDDRERQQEPEEFIPALQNAAGQFANDHRMADNIVFHQQTA